MKKFLLTALCLMLMLVLPAYAEDAVPEVFTSGDFSYILLADDTAEITNYVGDEESLAIPAELDGYAVTSIGDWAFASCDSLTSVSIPDSVTSIGDYAFAYCDSLTDISVSPDHPALATIDGVLFSKADKRLICYPCGLSAAEYAVPDGILAIGDSAFAACDSLTSVSIPDSVTSIGDSAFSSCDSLTDISVSPDHPTLEVIDGVLFSKADKRLICYPSALSATEYAIPNGILIIGDKAFSGCESLISVSIPDSVTSIGDRAFYECNSLTSVSIPDSVTSIGDYAFDSCDSLTSVSIPDSVTSIGDYAFFWCSSLTSVSIPDSVTSIGDSAFYSCDSLTSVSIPDSVTSIGDYAFTSCDSLTSVSIPDSVASVGANPFAYCDSLTDISVSPDHPALATIDGVLFSKPDKRLICYPYTLTAAEYAIPDGTLAIGDYAFSSCYSLTSVSIPDSVTSIGDYAFYECNSLTSVSIPDSVTSIGDHAFFGCDSLTVGRDSVAAQYAEDNGIDYTYPDSLDWLTE